MKIGFDIDGVLIDSERRFRFWTDFFCYFNLNKERNRWDTTSQEKCFDLKETEIATIRKTVYRPITDKSPLMIGAKEIMQKLKKDGHEFYTISLRGQFGEHEQKSAKKVLKKLGVKFDGMFWNQKSKVKKAEELGIDIFIDDNAENVEQFIGSKIKVLFFREAKIRHIEAENIIEVDSWMDIYREIKKIDKQNEIDNKKSGKTESN